jgi:Tfp pilus assembly protein PilO
MAKDRRKHLIRIVELAALGLALVDAALYFAAVQPLRNMTQEASRRFEDERLQIRNEDARVKRLEWYEAAVPSSEKELGDFMRHQVLARRKSFTRLAKLLRGIAEHSGVELSNFTSRPVTERDEPLDRVNIQVNVTGPFPSLMNFAHGLETATGDFIVIHDFDFDSAEDAKLALKLSADLYLTP